MKIIVGYFTICLCLFLSISSESSAQITGIKIAGDTCTDISLALQAEGTSSSPYFFWEFGDPASGTNDTATFTGLSAPPFPTHTFSAPGVYTVCVSFQEPGQPVTKVCRTLSVQFCCNATINSGDSCLENNIPFSFTSAADISSVTWNFGDPGSGAANSSSSLTPSHKFSSPGLYTVSLSINATCGIINSTYSQKVVRCSTNNSNCTGLILSGDTCFGKDVSFDIQSDKTVSSVNWNFGDATGGANNTAIGKNSLHRFSAPGNYTVTAIVNFDCGVDTLTRVVRSVSCDSSIIINPPADSNCKLNFPNAFSPNNDNINDRFGGKFNCGFESYELIIANRWGEIIFKSNDPSNKWDGLIQAKEAEMGVYYYSAKFRFFNQGEQRISGDVLLLR